MVSVSFDVVSRRLEGHVQLDKVCVSLFASCCKGNVRQMEKGWQMIM